MTIRSLCVILLYLLPARAIPQYNQAQSYDVNAGGSMNTEFTNIFCDASGRIWMCNNTGFISCFDGQRFTHYPSEVTGHYTASAQFFEDRNGIWVLRHDYSIALFANGQWQHWTDPVFRQMAVDKATNQVVGVEAKGSMFHYDGTNTKWINHANAPTLPANCEYFLLPSLDEHLYLLQILKRDTTLQPLVAYMTPSLISPEWTSHPDKIFTEFFSGRGIISSTLSSGEVHQKLYTSDNIGIPKLPHASTYHFMGTSGGKLFLYHSTPTPSMNREVELFMANDQWQFERIAKFMGPHRNMSLTIDHAGHIWMASMGGLTRIDPALSGFYEGDPNMVPGLHTINEDRHGNIWFGGYGTGVCFFDGTTLHPSPPEAAHIKRFLPGSYNDEQGQMAFWTEDYGLVTNMDNTWNGTEARNNKSNNFGGYYFFDLDAQHVAAGFQTFGLGITRKPLKHDSEWKFIGKEKGMLLDNVLTISMDTKKRLWLGRSSQGIAIYDTEADTAQTWIRQANTDFDYGMMSSVIDPFGRMWMGCSDGLRVVQDATAFDLFEDEIYAKDVKISMDEAGYSQVGLLKVSGKFLVFGNFAGFGLLDLHSYSSNPSSPRIYFFPTNSLGGPSEQNAVLTDSKGFLWIGQDRGATRIDIEKLHLDSLPVDLIIDSVHAGAEKIELTYDTQLPNTIFAKNLPTLKRYVEIYLHPSFTGLLHDNVGFQYRLLHDKMQDTTWSDYAKTNKITFSYLAPGDNLIQIRAIKNNQVADVVELQLDVPLALSENPVFWTVSIGSLGLLGALFSFLFYRQRIQLQKAQINLSEQRREKEKFQIRAIASSLNPHFIKNSLNWAQTRFRSDKKVVTVIEELTTNISTIFKRSREGQAFHSLKDEFELVKNFLSIQQTTYGNFLDISFPDAALIERFHEVIVPLLQVQIHVENAIEHGIRNRTGAHLLSIDLQDEGDYLLLTITDDGIGRKRAIEMGSQGTQQGTHMLKSLYEIVNQYNTKQFSTWYEDLPLVDPVTQQKIGTRVHIRIPKQYEIPVI